MWRCCVCAIMLAACTDSGSNSDIQLEAAVHDPTLSLSVWGTIPSNDVGEVQFIVDAQAVSGRVLGQTFPGELNAFRVPPGYYAEVDLAVPVADGEPIDITIERGSTSAVMISALPADFTIAPLSGQKIGKPVDIAWSPTSDDRMSWTSSDCVMDESDGGVPTDAGMLEFPPIVFNPDNYSMCPDAIELEMIRSRTTMPDTGFRYVTFTTKRQHTVDSTIAP